MALVEARSLDLQVRYWTPVDAVRGKNSETGIHAPVYRSCDARKRVAVEAADAKNRQACARSQRVTSGGARCNVG